MKPLDKSIGLKVADDPLDVVNEFAPDAKDDSVVPRESCFRENYRHGSFLHLHFAWGLRNGERDTKALCARFEWLLDDLGGAIDHSPLGHEPWSDNDDGAVFIDVVEFTQDPERVGVWGKGLSLVWLRPQDRCELLWPEKVAQVRDAPRLLLKELLLDEDREVHSPQNVGICRARFHHRVRDVIQAGPQLMNGVAEGQSGLWQWCHRLGWAGTRLPLKLVVDNGCLTVVYSGTPAKDSVLEVTEVLLTPLDLTLGWIQ